MRARKQIDWLKLQCSHVALLAMLTDGDRDVIASVRDFAHRARAKLEASGR